MQAINKYRRNGKRAADKKAIFEEIADVLIMIAQMRFLFEDNGEVDEFIQTKLDRLEKRIQDHKSELQQTDTNSINPDKAKQGKLDL